MCLYNRFTTFCQHWLNWNKSPVWVRCHAMLCYFPFIVGFILSRFCSCHVLPYFIKWNQRPTSQHSLRSRCSTKKPAFNVTGNLVMVMKFTFQSIFGNSCQNPRHASAQGREESLELHSILWSDWQTSKLKVLHHRNCFAAHVRRRYFSEEEKQGPEICLRFAG